MKTTIPIVNKKYFEQQQMAAAAAAAAAEDELTPEFEKIDLGEEVTANQLNSPGDRGPAAPVLATTTPATATATATAAAAGAGVQALTVGLGNGVNLQPSYYNGGQVDFHWALMKQYPFIKTVRIEIEPSVDIGVALRWVTEAHQNGYAVIATYHKHSVLGTSKIQELMDAANWWRTNFNELNSAAGGTLTVNLMNEWGGQWILPSQYAHAYNQAIAIVREVYSGPVIIDVPGWGQQTHTVAVSLRRKMITDTNVIPSVHVYPRVWNWARLRRMRPSDLDELGAVSPRGLLIGEFGSLPKAFLLSADWHAIVSHAKQKGYSVLAWCWNGDGGPMNMVDPSWASNPSANTGQVKTSGYLDSVYPLLSP